MKQIFTVLSATTCSGCGLRFPVLSLDSKLKCSKCR